MNCMFYTLETALGTVLIMMGLPRWLSGKESACQCRRHRRRMLDPWVDKISWRRKWQPTLVLLPGKSHRPRNLRAAGCGFAKDSDTTEKLNNNNSCPIISYFPYHCKSERIPHFQENKQANKRKKKERRNSHACLLTNIRSRNLILIPR